MEQSRPYVMSIGGLDPTAGAGILADVKTFESCRVLGFGIATAITAQTGTSFHHVQWLNEEEIIRQIDPLLDTYAISYIKIGLIRDMATFQNLVAYLKIQNPKSKIIWDPIMKASAGYRFHSSASEASSWPHILNELYLITPNTEESAELTGLSAEEGAVMMAGYTNVYLKGGHNPEKRGYDVLYQPHRAPIPFSPVVVSKYSKHGTGCVFSSCVSARLALGYSLPSACKHSKDYITSFIDSNPSELGYHQNMAYET